MNLFIDEWHKMSDVTPDNEDVWVLIEGAMVPARYSVASNKFTFTDGDTIDGTEIYQWRYLGDPNIAGYPLENEIVGIVVPELDICALAKFTSHYEDKRTGDDLFAAVLSSDYEFDCTNDNAVNWFKVSEWYRLPELPEVVMTSDDCYYKDQTVYQDDSNLNKRTFLDEIPDQVEVKPLEEPKEEVTEESKGEAPTNGTSAIKNYKK